MQGTTLVISILGSVLVLFLRPVYALGVCFGLIVWYPEYLAISVGSIYISVGRVIVAILLLRCLCDYRIRKNFSWSSLDKWVSLSMVVYVGMYCITHRPLASAIENRGGFIMDTWFSYLVVRLILTDKRKLFSFIKIMAVFLVSLAVLGVIECFTHHSFFFALQRFRPWRAVETVVDKRWGLTRAAGPFSHFILFGAFFAMFLPLVWALRHHRGYWSKLAYPLSAFAIVGTFSSMSSGPWSMLVVVIFCLALEKYRHWIKPLLVSFVLFCILAEVGSNRPLHYVLFSYANMAGGVYWQRVRLIDAAIENFGQWWLAGYGGIDPGWASREGGYFWGGFTDLNNEFIAAGVEYGMLGVLAVAAVFISAFRSLVRSYRSTKDRELRSLYWSMGCSLVGIFALVQGVSLFGQAVRLFYCILGMIGASCFFANHVKNNGKDLFNGHIEGGLLLHNHSANFNNKH